MKNTLKVRINGRELSNVEMISYHKELNSVTVITYDKNEVEIKEIDTDYVVVDIIQNVKEFKPHIDCELISSNLNKRVFFGASGKYNCVSISNDGVIRLTDLDQFIFNGIKNGKPDLSVVYYDLKVDKYYVEYLRELATSEKGALVINIDESGKGKIMNLDIEL